MRLDKFFDNFELLADAPNGVQKLRELVLQLAVQGKLVPQDPNDEPASVMLEKIKAEKEWLVKEKKISQPKPLLPIEVNEVPHKLPKGWKWARFGEIVLDIESGWSPMCEKRPKEVGEWGVLKVSAVSWDKFNPHENKALPVSLEPKPEHETRVGDFLMSRANTSQLVGKSVIVETTPKRLLLSDKLLRVFFSDLTNKRFFNLCNNSPAARNYYSKKASGTSTSMRNISRGQILDMPIPVPPFKEQKRIVAKIDQLMALCSELEARQQKRREGCVRLNNAALDQLLTTCEPDDFSKHWQRICDNFDLLYSAPENIGKLRQAILQLAVQGKLVTQDPNDEPASVLLEKIKAEKEQLIKEGKIKKDKPLLPIKLSEVPYKLPTRWEWVRLETLCELITKGSSPKWQGVNYVEPGSGILFITSENVRSYYLNLEEPKYVEEKFNKIEPRSILKRNDILMNIVGASIGRTAMYSYDEIANINQAVCLIRIVDQTNLLSFRYLLHFFNSPVCISFMFDKQVDNARANLSMGNISNFLVPLPPYQVQNKIVETIDQLMALCDKLEAKLTQSKTNSDKLMDAAVRQVLTA